MDLVCHGLLLNTTTPIQASTTCKFWVLMTSESTSWEPLRPRALPADIDLRLTLGLQLRDTHCFCTKSENFFCGYNSSIDCGL